MEWILLLLYYGADTKRQRTLDSIKVINYVFDNFEYVNIQNYINKNFEQYQNYFTNNVNLYKTTTLPILKLSEQENYTFPLKPNSISKLETKIYTLNTLSSQNLANSKIGQITIYYESQVLCTIDIILTNNLKPNSWFYYFKKIFKEYNQNFYEV